MATVTVSTLNSIPFNSFCLIFSDSLGHSVNRNWTQKNAPSGQWDQIDLNLIHVVYWAMIDDISKFRINLQSSSGYTTARCHATNFVSWGLRKPQKNSYFVGWSTQKQQNSNHDTHFRNNLQNSLILQDNIYIDGTIILCKFQIYSISLRFSIGKNVAYMPEWLITCFKLRILIFLDIICSNWDILLHFIQLLDDHMSAATTTPMQF